MYWTNPHVSKIFEAIGVIGDNRIEIIEEVNQAKMYSPSRNKFYTVTWNDDLTKMMSNDNSAFFVGQLSYPMISVLMLKNKIKYDHKLESILSNIKWKDINKSFKNDFNKTVKFVLDDLKSQGKDTDFVIQEINKVVEQIAKLRIERLGKRIKPPKGY